MVAVGGAAYLIKRAFSDEPPPVKTGLSDEQSTQRDITGTFARQIATGARPLIEVFQPSGDDRPVYLISRNQGGRIGDRKEFVHGDVKSRFDSRVGNLRFMYRDAHSEANPEAIARWVYLGPARMKGFTTSDINHSDVLPQRYGAGVPEQVRGYIVRSKPYVDTRDCAAYSFVGSILPSVRYYIGEEGRFALCLYKSRVYTLPAFLWTPQVDGIRSKDPALQVKPRSDWFPQGRSGAARQGFIGGRLGEFLSHRVISVPGVPVMPQHTINRFLLDFRKATGHKHGDYARDKDYRR